MLSKDQFLFEFVKGVIHLSKKDYSFLHNISVLVKDKKFLTENQTKLFDKLIIKYQKQIKKSGYNTELILNLPWHSQVVESKLEYLQARVSIVNDNIIIKTPFNNQFITAIRKVDLNQFIWDKQNKHYIIPFSTYHFKLATEIVPKYFENFLFCEKTEQLIESTQYYNDAKFWSPTLIKVADNFYVASCNEQVSNAIKDIPLNDSPKTLFLLSQYGVSIDQSVTKQNPKLELAAKHNNTIDIDYIETLVTILKELDIETVFTSRDIVHNKMLANEIKLAFLEKGIVCKPFQETKKDKGVLIKSTSFYRGPLENVDKIITITNSRPIKIR